MVVFSIVFGRFARLPSDALPYSVFTYSALVPWTYFANVLPLHIEDASTSVGAAGRQELFAAIPINGPGTIFTRIQGTTPEEREVSSERL